MSNCLALAPAGVARGVVFPPAGSMACIRQKNEHLEYALSGRRHTLHYLFAGERVLNDTERELANEHLYKKVEYSLAVDRPCTGGVNNDIVVDSAVRSRRAHVNHSSARHR